MELTFWLAFVGFEYREAGSNFPSGFTCRPVVREWGQCGGEVWLPYEMDRRV